MNSMRSKRLSTWKTIIVKDLLTGEKKQFELDEKERLIEKIKPDRRKLIPQEFVKIRITKKFIEQHQELNNILNKMITTYDKSGKKKETKTSNKEEESLLIQQEATEENSEKLYEDLIDPFFIHQENDEIEFEQGNEFIPPDELNLLHFF